MYLLSSWLFISVDTGTGIPSYIIDLPRTVFSSPGGAMLRPMIESMSRGMYSADPFGQQQQQLQQSQQQHQQLQGPTGTTALPAPLSSLLVPTTPSSGAAALASRDVAMAGVGSDGTASASEIVTNATSRSAERALLSSLNETIAAPSSDPRVTSGALTTRETIINKPLVSGDTDPALVRKLGTKILSQQAPNEAGVLVNVLSATEAALIESVVAVLTSNQAHGTAAFSPDAFRLLLRLIDAFPALQTACLFFLRLMVLYQADVNETVVSTVHTVSKKLNRSDAAQSPSQQLASGPAKFMAMCTVANFFSRIPPCALEGTAATLDHVVDAAIAELCGPGVAGSRPETRQVSAAALHNLVLLQLGQSGNSDETATPESSTAPLEVIADENAPVAAPSVDDVHPHVVQILCSTLEGIEDEADHTVLHRRVSIAYNILTCASATRDLFVDLGFKDTLQNLRQSLRQRNSSTEDVLNSIDQLLMLL